MNSDRWKKIERLCYKAKSLEGEERTTYIQRACGDDDQLLEEVNSLLEFHEQKGLHEPLVQLKSSMVFSDDPSLSDQTIGPYRLIRTIGSGGFGQVYLAVRNDDQFERFVALKVMRGLGVNEDAVSRFYEERQILASLNHPHIARLFDGGKTAEEMPWFAMEYIEGEPITTYCNNQNLDLGERVTLFQKVCSAVQYAHQNLVVHRDLKPANIMITPEGTPKLLDFGIATLMEQEQESETDKHQVLTPEYASPEQVLNKPISTASDVYSLGVLLYQLLTGALPYEFQNRNSESIKQTILHSIPQKPSNITGAKTLAGDLDSIILKALSKNPTDRYASVEQLAGDLEKYQHHLPLLAGNHTFGYRAKKFLSRHTWSVAASTVLTLLIISFATVTYLQSQAIEARAIDAEQQRDRAEQVSTFLTDLFESVDPNIAENQSLSAVGLLDRGAERVETEFADRPQQQANLYLVISDVYENLGQFDEGLDLAIRAYDLLNNLHPGNHPQKARSLNAMGWFYRQKGEYEKADSLLTAGLTMRRHLYGSDHLDVSRSLNDLAVLKQSRGDYTATDTLLQEAIAIRKKLAGPQDQSVATALSNYASLKYRLGDLSEAQANMREALEIFQKSVGEKDLRTSNVMTNLAAILLYSNKTAEAEQLYQNSLQIRIELLGENHPDVAYSYAHLGNLYRYKKEFNKAEPLILKALSIRQKLPGDDEILVADTKQTLAYLYSAMNKLSEAEHYYTEAINTFQTAFPDGHIRTAKATHLLGEVYMEMNNHATAASRFEEAMKLREKFYGTEDLRTINSTIKYGVCLSKNGKPTSSEPLLRRSLKTLEQIKTKTSFSKEQANELKTLAEQTLAQF